MLVLLRFAIVTNIEISSFVSTSSLFNFRFQLSACQRFRCQMELCSSYFRFPFSALPLSDDIRETSFHAAKEECAAQKSEDGDSDRYPEQTLIKRAHTEH